jgi:hypothetical protein
MGVGPGKEGFGHYTHYCANCNKKVALKRPFKDDADVYGPKE